MSAQDETQTKTDPDSKRSAIKQFLDERLGLSVLAYPVPAHANTIPYLVGGITLFGFIILFITGILLAQYYNPDPSQAHASVIYIITQTGLGDFIRSLHFWTANLVVITLLAHLIRVFFTGSYKRPREINWFVGLGLFAVTLGLVFTGTVLKWDQESVEALAHNREVGELLGLLGVWFTTSFTLSVPILTRLYIGHLTLLPALFTILIIAHIYLIKQHGISREPVEEAVSGPPTKSEGTSRFTTHLRRMTGYGLMLLALAAALSLAIPARLGQAGVSGVEVTKPPWIFLPFYPLEDILGLQGILVGAGILFGALALVPILDRSPWLSPKRRRWIIAAGVILLVLLIVLGIFAWTTRPVPHLMG